MNRIADILLCRIANRYDDLHFRLLTTGNLSFADRVQHRIYRTILVMAMPKPADLNRDIIDLVDDVLEGKDV